MSVNNLIVISDLHCGCQMGLCPRNGIRLDNNGTYKPSTAQVRVLDHWDYFWKTWVPKVTRGEPYAVAVNGDAIEGIHHRSVTQISSNIEIHRRIAYEMLAPVRAKAATMYMVRGTEAHTGQSGQDEEELAKDLDAMRNPEGRASRDSLWVQVGNCRVHLAHHVGTTSSTAYEASAPLRGLVSMFEAAGRWGHKAPDVVVRSHRHQHVEARVPTARGYGIVFTTPAWQLPGPFVYKVSPDKAEFPQIGGSLVRQGDEEFYTRHYVQTIKQQRISRPRVEGK